MNKVRREQRGYVFHRGKSWFVRYCDDRVQRDGTIKRKLVCEKLTVQYCDEFRTKASVRPFVQEVLAPINAGLLRAESTTRIVDFIEERFRELEAEERKFREAQALNAEHHIKPSIRTSTVKGYEEIFRLHVRARLGDLTFREFQTFHGEQMLQAIARETKLSANSLKRIKSFLSGVFNRAKRLGFLNTINPIVGVSIPQSKPPAETFAYSLEETRRMLAVLDEPTRTVILTAALTGLRKGEISGLRWGDLTDRELAVNRSLWQGLENDPKTRASKARIPIVKELGDALDEHRERLGKLAAPSMPIFPSGGKQPLNLDNLARRTIIPRIERCKVCGDSKRDHKTEGHMFTLDESLQWHGWHAFRRGVATNLHALGVDDKTIQAILRHSNISVTQNLYIKSVPASRISAMDLLGAEFKKSACNDLATKSATLPN